MNRAPKFGKVELLVINELSTNKDPKIPNVDKITFEDCGLMITGDYIIVIVDEKDELKDTLTSTGRIFPLNKVQAYKTHSM